jgi:hypothetical protein
LATSEIGQSSEVIRQGFFEEVIHGGRAQFLLRVGIKEEPCLRRADW